MSWLQRLLGTSRLIEDLGKNGNTSIDAREALIRKGSERALQPLLRALSHPNAHVRKEAAGVLGKLGDRRAVPHLIAALKSRDDDLRSSATRALKDLGDENAVPALLDRLHNDAATFVRVCAVDALGKHKSRPVLDGLLQATRDKHGQVRQHAIEALRQFPADDRSVDRAIVLMDDSDPDVRANAAKLLGSQPNARSTALLIERLGDPDSRVMFAAIKALCCLRAKEAVIPLTRLLRDSWSQVRSGAAEALGELGDAQAAAPLAESLRNEDDLEVRKAIEDALAKLGARNLADAADEERAKAILGLKDFSQVKTTDLEKALTVLFEEAILAVPVVDDEYIDRWFVELRSAWGSRGLSRGQESELRAIIQMNLRRLAAGEFGFCKISALCDQRCAQVDVFYVDSAGSPTGFKAIRLWRAASGFVACGDREFH
jgi:HEAT repeat protein